MAVRTAQLIAGIVDFPFNLEAVFDVPGGFRCIVKELRVSASSTAVGAVIWLVFASGTGTNPVIRQEVTQTQGTAAATYIVLNPNDQLRARAAAGTGLEVFASGTLLRLP